MKDKIQKLAGLNQEVVELIKEEKMDDAVEKLAQIQELTKEMDEASVETPAEDPKTDGAEDGEGKEAVEKAEKIEKAMEMLEKWSSLNIGADTIKDLISQFEELKETITTSGEAIEKMGERLEVVEKAKGISKQAGEKVNKESNNVWDSLGAFGG